MIVDLLKDNLGPQAYKKLVQLFGEPEEVLSLRRAFERAEDELRRMEDEHAERLERSAGELARNAQELERARQEKLEWMAKESAIRKELQDCQERSKELLEKVVQLTHQKRTADKDLLDQKFRTEATPLERNRYEMELTEARGKVRRADERVREIEEKMARTQAQFDSLKAQADRAKNLETDLAWSREQAETHHEALGAAVQRVSALEAENGDLKTRVAGLEQANVALKLAADRAAARLVAVESERRRTLEAAERESARRAAEDAEARNAKQRRSQKPTTPKVASPADPPKGAKKAAPKKLAGASEQPQRERTRKATEPTAAVKPVTRTRTAAKPYAAPEIRPAKKAKRKG